MPTNIDNFLETTFGVYLDSHRVEKGEICTFTGMGNIRGKFTIKDEHYPHFLDLLHEYLFTQQRRPLNLVEQRRTDLNTPIIIDLDFKYSPERAIQRQFELSHIHNFIKKYVENITYFYKLDNYKPLRFFITLRPAPYEDKKQTVINRTIKDGVHIECPDLVLHSEHQQVLRHRSIELENLSNSFKDIEYINAEKDIFDEAIVKKTGWFFYGESKPDIPAYTLASVYVYNPKTESFYEDNVHDYTSRQLLELLSIRYNLRNDIIPFNENTREEWNTRLDFCTGKRTTIVDDTPHEIHMTCITTNNVYEQIKLDEIAIAKKLALECLSAKRATGYQSWVEVGWCLHNIDPSENMFNTWMEFSNKCSKASENNTNSLLRDWNYGWNRSQHERYFTIRSLHMWAKHDNLEKYKKIMNESFVDFVEREVDATHTHIARLMKRMYGNNYCAAVDSKKVDWYEFNGISWKKLAQGIDLRNKMTTEVAQVISDTRTKIRNRLATLNKDERDFEETRMKKMTKIEQCLYTSGFKDSVMKECIGLFYEEDFAQKLNSNQYLIGFNNGIIDLHAIRKAPDGSDEFYVNFRKSEPTDFVNFMAGRYSTKLCEPIDYIEYNHNDPEQLHIHNEIDNFMTKVFPRKDLREYMWRKLASCLEGANKEQKYETWIGVGGNGKSKLVDLMSMCLGDYASSLQSTVMTRKRPESGAANPDIMAIRNKRFIYMAEPDDREALNTSRMKQFTGEDDVEARGLFEDQSKFKITGKIFMLCNTLPTINTMDTGTWRRINVVPFESKFVDTTVEKSNPDANIYPRDNNLDEKLRRWRTLFMSRLIHIYKTEYLPNGIGEDPVIISRESNSYKDTFDSFAKFIKERTYLVKDCEENKDEFFRQYKNWYIDIGGGIGRKLSQPEFYKRLYHTFGLPNKPKICGVKLFKSNDDLDEFCKSRIVHA